MNFHGVSLWKSRDAVAVVDWCGSSCWLRGDNERIVKPEQRRLSLVGCSRGEPMRRWRSEWRKHNTRFILIEKQIYTIIINYLIKGENKTKTVHYYFPTDPKQTKTSSFMLNLYLFCCIFLYNHLLMIFRTMIQSIIITLIIIIIPLWLTLNSSFSNCRLPRFIL